MKLTQIVHKDAVIPSLQASERDEVISELLEAAIAADVVEAQYRDELLAAVLEREKRGSTGFGKGVAVPHVKHASIESMGAAIGISENGVDFSSLDKQPVYSVFLLLSPADKPEEHLQAMEIIFKNLSQDTFRRFLRQAGSVDDVLTLLSDADAQKLVG